MENPDTGTHLDDTPATNVPAAVEQFEAVIERHLSAYQDESRHRDGVDVMAAPVGSPQFTESEKAKRTASQVFKTAVALDVPVVVGLVVSSFHVEAGDDASNPWLSVMMVSLIGCLLFSLVAFISGAMARDNSLARVYLPAPVIAAARDVRQARERLLAVEAPVEVLVKAEALQHQVERLVVVLAEAERAGRSHSPQSVSARDEVFLIAAEVGAVVEVATVRHQTVMMVQDLSGMPRERLLAEGVELMENTALLRTILDGPNAG